MIAEHTAYEALARFWKWITRRDDSGVYDPLGLPDWMLVKWAHERILREGLK